MTPPSGRAGPQVGQLEAASVASARAGAVSRDLLLGGRVSLDQPASGYRAAIDPILLAAAVPVFASGSVLDLGCGVGAAALCLLARVPAARVTGLDLQRDLVRLAGENARRNGVADRFVPIAGDVAKLPPRLAPGGFDHVMCNPPHLKAGAGRPSPDPVRDMANREGPADLKTWVGAALAMARPKGSVTLIHRADRLDEILAALLGRAGDVAVCPLWPGPGKPARRVIVQARKGAAGPLRLLPGLVLHRPEGAYTAAADGILRDAAPLGL